MMNFCSLTAGMMMIPLMQVPQVLRRNMGLAPGATLLLRRKMATPQQTEYSLICTKVIDQ